MKILFIIIALFSFTAQADEWRTGDTYREGTFQILNIIDWRQSIYMAKHPDKFKESEAAWLIGQYPSTTDVDRLILISAILHPIIAYNLPYGWREVFQYITIAGKLNATTNNAYIGLKLEF